MNLEQRGDSSVVTAIKVLRNHQGRLGQPGGSGLSPETHMHIVASLKALAPEGSCHGCQNLGVAFYGRGRLTFVGLTCDAGLSPRLINQAAPLGVTPQCSFRSEAFVKNLKEPDHAGYPLLQRLGELLAQEDRA